MNKEIQITEEAFFEIDFEMIEESLIILEMKGWRLYFTDHEIKTFIAEALNTTVVHTRIGIRGYLVANWQIYLILWANENELERFIKKLNAVVLRNLLAHLARRKEQPENELSHSSDLLFHTYPFINYPLYKQLIGESPGLDYFDPYNERLKAYLATTNYSSVADYTGAKGPVFVTKL